MFIGHFATGLAAKKVARKPSLGTLFLAAQFIDLLWPLLLLLGLEAVAVDPHNTVVTPLNFIDYPISHSLLGVALWGLFFGLIYYLIKRDVKSAVWLGLLVISHWVLDFFTHRPDLPLAPGPNAIKVGLGLWNSLAGTLLLELGLFAAGSYLYLSVTKAKNKIGVWAFWTFIAFLLLMYVINIFGPPPPADPQTIGWAGMAQWLLIAWGYWIDRNRDAS